MCKWIAKEYGLLVGGSTGTVLSAIKSNKNYFEEGKVIVAISPDTGNGYINTIYDDEWCEINYLLGQLNESSEEEIIPIV
ncbi:hypothetical protein P4S72_24350 [Vibrio sp. PP-XX7]